MATRPSSLRPLAAAATALAIGLAACGGDDGDTDPANAGGSTTAAGQAGQPAGDEAQIKALVASLQDAFRAADGQTVCDSVTDRGQRDLIAFGRTLGHSGSCQKVANGFLQAELEAGTQQRPVKVVAVRVRGDRATALLRIPGATTLQQRYQRVDDRWKVESFNLAATAGATDQQ